MTPVEGRLPDGSPWSSKGPLAYPVPTIHQVIEHSWDQLCYKDEALREGVSGRSGAGINPAIKLQRNINCHS